MTIASVAFGTGKAAISLGKAALWVANRPTKKFEEARDEMFREWVAELAWAMRQQADSHADLEGRSDELEVRLNEPAYRRAVEILEHEATLEPLPARRRMFAFAAAGWANLDLRPSELSRVLRIVRELDPDDVLLLHTLGEHGDDARPRDSFEPSANGVERYGIAANSQLSADMLMLSGCTIIRYTTGLNNRGAEVHVTQAGKWVLLALDPYIRATVQDNQFPSRPLEELARALPEGPDKARIEGYQALADMIQELKQEGHLSEGWFIPPGFSAREVDAQQMNPESP